MQEGKIAGEHTHIRCKVIIEVLGKPKGHVEKALKMYVDKIKQDSELIVLKEEFVDAKEKQGLWATFAELEMVAKGIRKLIAFCFDYMPSSVQILKPESYILDRSMIEDFVNDLQARLHDVDMIVKKQKNENEFLKKNMNTTVKNMILISLLYGSLDSEKLSKVTGIKSDELGVFLDNMVEDNKIKKENGSYSLVKKEMENAQE